MTDHVQPQRSGTTAPGPADEHVGAGEPPAAPISRMLANPRRVRRA